MSRQPSRQHAWAGVSEVARVRAIDAHSAIAGFAALEVSVRAHLFDLKRRAGDQEGSAGLSRMSAKALLAQTEARGATFLPGTRCFANGQGDDAIRLAFSFLPAEQIEEGIGRIGAAMRSI